MSEMEEILKSTGIISDKKVGPIRSEGLRRKRDHELELLRIKEKFNIADNDPVFALIQADAAHIGSIVQIVGDLEQLMAEADNRLDAAKELEAQVLNNECERLGREIAERQSFIKQAKEETREVFETFRSHQERFAYQITQIQKTHEAQEERQRKRFKSFEGTLLKAENFSWVLAGLLGVSVVTHVLSIAFIMRAL